MENDIDQFTKKLFYLANASILDNFNIDHAELNCVTVLNNVAIKEFSKIFKTISISVQNGKRTQPSLSDAAVALSINGLKISDLTTYIDHVKPFQLPFKVPSYPVAPKCLRDTKPGPKELAYRKIYHPTVPIHFPAMYPEMDEEVQQPTPSVEIKETEKPESDPDPGKAAQIGARRPTERRRKTAWQFDDIPDFTGMTAKDLGISDEASGSASCYRTDVPKIIEKQPTFDIIMPPEPLEGRPNFKDVKKPNKLTIRMPTNRPRIPQRQPQPAQFGKVLESDSDIQIIQQIMAKANIPPPPQISPHGVEPPKKGILTSAALLSTPDGQSTYATKFDKKAATPRNAQDLIRQTAAKLLEQSRQKQKHVTGGTQLTSTTSPIRLKIPMAQLLQKSQHAKSNKDSKILKKMQKKMAKEKAKEQEDARVKEILQQSQHASNVQLDVGTNKISTPIFSELSSVGESLSFSCEGSSVPEAKRPRLVIKLGQDADKMTTIKESSKEPDQPVISMSDTKEVHSPIKLTIKPFVRESSDIELVQQVAVVSHEDYRGHFILTIRPKDLLLMPLRNSSKSNDDSDADNEYNSTSSDGELISAVENTRPNSVEPAKSIEFIFEEKSDARPASLGTTAITPVSWQLSNYSDESTASTVTLSSEDEAPSVKAASPVKPPQIEGVLIACVNPAIDNVQRTATPIEEVESPPQLFAEKPSIAESPPPLLEKVPQPPTPIHVAPPTEPKATKVNPTPPPPPKRKQQKPKKYIGPAKTVQLPKPPAPPVEPLKPVVNPVPPRPIITKTNEKKEKTQPVITPLKLTIKKLVQPPISQPILEAEKKKSKKKHKEKDKPIEKIEKPATVEPLKLKVPSLVIKRPPSSQPESVKQVEEVKKIDEKKQSVEKKEAPIKPVKPCAKGKDKPPGKKVPSKKPKKVQERTASAASIIDEDKSWNCPICSKVYQEDGPAMIGCDKCDHWYHWQCVGIIEPPPDNQPWYCRSCAAKLKASVPSDERKTALPPSKKRKVS